MRDTLEEIKACTSCRGTNLKFIPNYEHEDVELNTTKETVIRTDDVVLCLDCETLYYLEHGYLAKEIPFKIQDKLKNLNWVSDQEVAKEKMLCTE